MRLDSLLGEQGVRSAEEWNRVIDSSLEFHEGTITDSLTIGRGV